ncbi:MAG: glucose-1-phosphate thymidylyltransferase [Planctomycetaceae bacterium]|nr:glucose-1-phosphate thymidylyltransferase [Planctomycetaceae bacterium]
MDKAVILARGLGTRMRVDDDQAAMTATQAAVAGTGVKALIPVGTGRPFLDYVMNALADAGYRHICLVIGPEHDAVREYYDGEAGLSRLTVEYAVQADPLGTANAVASAETFAAGDSLLVINSDNYYPSEATAALAALSEPGLAMFDRQAMVTGSNIEADRIAKFAVVQVDDDGYMSRIIEKPDAATMASLTDPIGVSLNCWRFDGSIFEACRSIEKSKRGEFELPDAVEYSMRHLGRRYRAVPVKLPVLDLSSRSDIAGVADRLAAVEVAL